MTNPQPSPRRDHRIAAVLMLLAASMAGVAASGTAPVLFVSLVLVFTGVALAFAHRGQFRVR